jgi:hypothetical protein
VAAARGDAAQARRWEDRATALQTQLERASAARSARRPREEVHSQKGGVPLGTA